MCMNRGDLATLPESLCPILSGFGDRYGTTLNTPAPVCTQVLPTLLEALIV